MQFDEFLEKGAQQRGGGYGLEPGGLRGPANGSSGQNALVWFVSI